MPEEKNAAEIVKQIILNRPNVSDSEIQKILRDMNIKARIGYIHDVRLLFGKQHTPIDVQTGEPFSQAAKIRRLLMLYPGKTRKEIAGLSGQKLSFIAYVGHKSRKQGFKVPKRRRK